MKSISSSTAEKWFKIVVLLGIGANVLLSIAGILAPNLTLKLLCVPPAYPDIWVRFSCLLLILLSLFYLPGALDPDGYGINVTLMLVARSAGVLFFPAMVILLKFAPIFLIFAVYDFIWGGLAAVFLCLSKCQRSTEEARGN